MESELLVDLMTCPNCGVEGPKTKFCLNCGSEKILESEDSFQEDVEETVEELEETIEELEETIEEMKENIEEGENVRARARPRSRHKRAGRKATDSALGYELDPIVKENMLDLAKSADLIIWLLDLFLKGNVEEEHFNQLFDPYEYRLEQCLKRRSQMLDSARDLKPMQKAMNEAMLRLSELEKKKIIGDISDEEYDLKAPVYRWDIEKYEREIGKRKTEISILEDLTQIISEEEITDMKEIAENSKGAVDDLFKSGTFSQETATKIKKSLEKTLAACKSLKNTK